MKKNFVLLTVFIFVFLTTNIGYSLSIIPGGKGFGMDTPAGSGRHLATPSTTVYKVTNLNDSGTGSLRYGLLEVNSPKVIIFEVSGTIELQKPIYIGSAIAETKGSYITIAGQTAPSPGITVKNNGITFDRNCHDILMQHIRIRSGDEFFATDPDFVDCLNMDAHYDVNLGWTPPYDIVIDHCSFSWSIDELVENGANNITYSNNIFSEGLNSPLHPKGPHSKGLGSTARNSGVTGAKSVGIAYNLFAHNVDRNPLIAAGSAVVSNNLIYDHWQGLFTTDEMAVKGEIQLSVVGNYFIETDITVRTIYVIAGSQAGTRIYLAGDNFFKGKIQTEPWSSIDQRLTASQSGTDVPDWAQASSPPVWPTGYTTMSAADARTYVLANAGARPADRDSVDVRIVNDVINGTGGIIASQNDVGGWPNLAQNTRTLTVPSSQNEVQASGYTKLEEWLHGVSRTVEGKSYISPLTLKLQ